ncbi:MAG: MFS transporter [Acetobacteraceae bacterium]|nr:MFS transporter [Acetobacteraceae bacterium]MCX7686023.1 MFS transporter [Acetobacteraceae bacterium]MDW8398676.1 MFS transporter [Acetobacteraceae bacterium]
MPPALRHALLLCLLFPSIGVTLPFLPAFLADRGLDPQQVSVVLALAALTRLICGPPAGRLADRGLGARRVLIAGCLLAAGTGLLYGAVSGFALLLLVAVLNAVPSGSLAPLAETVTVVGSRRGKGFDYGVVRGIGSVAFILASAGAGWAVGAFSTEVIPYLYAVLLVGAAGAAWLLPRDEHETAGRAAVPLAAALRFPGLARVIVVSGLLQGSHAIFYTFSAIHWQAAGISPFMVGLLWATAVGSEVCLFLFGRRLVERMGPRRLALAAAALAALRWGIFAETVWLPALFLANALHAASFGMMHLAAMRLVFALAPPGQASTAQTLHMALGPGLFIGVVTFAAGPLYAAFGGGAWWFAAGLCLLAIPIAAGLARR